MLNKIKVKCRALKKTDFEAYPFEADFRPVGEPRKKGTPRSRIVVSSNRELAFEPGRTYTLEIKSAE